MNDKELFKKVIAFGIDHSGVLQSLLDDGYESEMVRDWRVAGALMEKMPEGALVKLLIDYGSHCAAVDTLRRQGDAHSNESLPRAIIEACVEAPHTTSG